MCNRRYQKSTLRATNITAQTVAANATLAFDTIETTGMSIDESRPATLDKAGLYLITVDADGAVPATTAGTIAIQLYKNGQPVAGALASAYSAGTTETEHVSFTTVIEVPQGCCVVSNDAALTVVNIGAAAVFTNAAFTAVKLA